MCACKRDSVCWWVCFASTQSSWRTSKIVHPRCRRLPSITTTSSENCAHTHTTTATHQVSQQPPHKQQQQLSAVTKNPNNAAATATATAASYTILLSEQQQQLHRALSVRVSTLFGLCVRVWPRQNLVPKPPPQPQPLPIGDLRPAL